MRYVKKVLKKVLRRVFRPILLIVARGRISQIDSTNAVSRSLADVLIVTLNNHINPEEKIWIDKVESLRRELGSSSHEIQIADYGAGSPNLYLTTEQMSQGMTICRTIGDTCKRASKSYFWAFLLFRLIREYKPRVCLELGTCLGISGCYQAAALKINQFGTLITLEGAESLASIATQNFQILGFDNVKVVIGRFQDTLTDVLKQHSPIDYAFIDGHHDEQATKAYFKRMVPVLSDRAVLVFDDISWSEGMKRAWCIIESDERVKISVDLGSVGICILDSSIKKKQTLRIPIAWE